MKVLLITFALAILCLSMSASASASASAQQASEISAQQVQTNEHAQASELRAREIGRSLRCVVCQNQSIEASDAKLAKDMRKIVRDRVTAGDTNTQIIQYMRERYGDYVLLKPPVQSNTYVLWFLPLALILGGLIWFLRAARRRAAPPTHAELSPQDRAEIESLLKDTP